MSDTVHTHRDGDLRHQRCRCSACGFEATCTPECAFYGEDGAPLLCERCMLATAGFAEVPMLDLAQLVDGFANERNRR